MVKAVQKKAEPVAPYVDAIFHISPERVQARGRSLQLLLLHRRCASCWGTLLQLPNGGRDIEAAEHLEQIAQHCSATPDFIHRELPLAEAVFRILLAGGNQPMTTREIYEGLNERWVDQVNPRIPTIEGVYRILASDTFYGISEGVA